MTKTKAGEQWKLSGIYIPGLTKSLKRGGFHDEAIAAVVEAVNSHEALVKSLKETANALGEYCKTHQPMSFGACCAIRKDAQAALKAAGE